MRTAQKIVLTFILSSVCILVYQYQLSKARLITESVERSNTSGGGSDGGGGGTGNIEGIILNVNSKKLLSKNNNNIINTSATVTTTTTKTLAPEKHKNRILRNHDSVYNKNSNNIVDKLLEGDSLNDLFENNNNNNINECICDKNTLATGVKEEEQVSIKLLMNLYLT